LAISPDGALYFHYPCFDGLVSAAVAWDYLETTEDWRIEDLSPVNYHLQRTWLETPLPPRAAVVDFLYHPDAAFWADHHATSFLTEEVRRTYERLRSERYLLYDSASPSCAMLLWKRFGASSSDEPRFGEMVRWADRIDAARYETVEEAVFGSSAALEINATLSFDGDPDYGKRLLRSMRTMTLGEVAELPEVRARSADIRSRTELGLREVKGTIRLTHGDIAAFEANPGRESTVNRYSAYHFFPGARYSVALVNSGEDSKLTAMRNPWLDFEGVDLGPIFKKYGGGGHKRVASVVIRRSSGLDPRSVQREIVEEISMLDQGAVPKGTRALA
jgi:hypothetical protein